MGILEDKLEILDLIGRYSHTADGNDSDAYADVFTGDGVFHGRAEQPDEIIVKGREKIKRFHENVVSRRRNFQTTRHQQSATIFVEIGKDRAITRTYLMTTTRIDGRREALVGLTSIYEDEIVKTPTSWRIKYRKIYPDVKGVLQQLRNS